MAFELRLPDIGEGVAEGEIVRWLVAEGVGVKEDDPLVEVLTDKADIEIPSPVDGVLARILAQPGRTVKVGEVIALIEKTGAPATEATPGNKEIPAPSPGKPGPSGGTAPSRVDVGEVLATPAVRKLAKDLGVDLSAVPATGPGGRVTEEDVRSAAVPAAAELLPEERVPF